MASKGQTKVVAAERAQKAVALRRMGADYRAIAKALDIPVSSAYRAVMRGLAEIREETAEHAEDVLTLELTRLDEMIARLWKRVADGDARAIDSALRVMERRAKYLGLDTNEARLAAAAEVTADAQEAQVDWLYQTLTGVLDQLHLTDEQAARAPAVIAAHLQSHEEGATG